MPALSKKQQKFMGIVRSIQKGEQPASKFNKDAQDVAKDMKKKDVKDFASTKHKGLPMKKEMLDKLKEMVRVELESCGYTHSVSGKKLKSSGGTGPEDRYLKEMSAKSKKIINKLGKKEKEMFIDMVDMLGFDQVMADYKKDKKAFKQALKDMSESAIQEQTVTPISKIKDIKNLVKKDLVSYRGTGAGGNFEISIRNKKVPGYPPSFALLQKDEKKYQDIRSKQFKIKPVAKYFIKGSDLNQLKKFGHVGFLATNRRESVDESMNPSAIKKMRDEFEKTGQLPPHLKKFALDLKILKKKHKVKNIVVPGLEWMSDMKEQSVNEAKYKVHMRDKKRGNFELEKFQTGGQSYDYKKGMDIVKKLRKMSGSLEYKLVKEFRDKREADTARDQIGHKALYMIGAKDFVFGNSGGKKSLVFKIMRNSKGVSHIRMRLSSMDLYDMEFLAIRAGKIKVKSKEKGVYGDQLGVMIKKNTGLNIRL